MELCNKLHEVVTWNHIPTVLKDMIYMIHAEHLLAAFSFTPWSNSSQIISTGQVKKRDREREKKKKRQWKTKDGPTTMEKSFQVTTS